ncbi:MAG: Tad domain-containing protein [Bryobacteraceae bacterium]
MSQRAPGPGERGYTLLATGACVVAMVGMVGLAVDIGRMYIVRNEIQAYVDAAALAATLQLDGTTTGITRAKDAVAASTNRWHLGTTAFTGTQVDFSTAATGAWETDPATAPGYRYVRVRASATLNLYLIPAVTSARTSTINATAIAGQELKMSYSEGLLPFSPFPHDETAADYGYTVGQRYTLRWGPNPKTGQFVCAGDNEDGWVEKAEQGNASERGYIEDTSSAVIRDAIENDYQSNVLSLGDTVNMTGGNKQTQRDSLIARVNQDTDVTSATYAEYVASDTGNGRRLIAVPINTWYPEYKIIGFAAFFLLLPDEYPQGGNKSFCAEYVGPYVQGSWHQGAGGTGTYVVRLVE